MRRRFRLALIAAGALLAAGCATVPEGVVDAEAFECRPGTEGCDEIVPIGPGGSMEMDMGDFFFTITDTAAITGEVEVTAVNVSDQFHNAEFLGAAEGSAIPEAEGNETGTDTVLLFPGEWTVICNVPGHRAAGMETTITVYSTEEELEAAREQGLTDDIRDAEMAPAA